MGSSLRDCIPSAESLLGLDDHLAILVTERVGLTS